MFRLPRQAHRMHQPRPVWSVAVVAPRGVFPLLFLCFVCPVSADARVACRRRRGFPLPPVAVHHFAAPRFKSTGLGTVGPALIAAVGDDLAVTVRHAPPFFHPSSRGWACAVGAGAAGWDGAVAAGWGRTPRDASCRVDYLTPCGRGGGSAARGAAGRPSAVRGTLFAPTAALAHRLPPPPSPSPPSTARAPVSTSSTPTTGLPAFTRTPSCSPAPSCCPGRQLTGRWSA